MDGATVAQPGMVAIVTGLQDAKLSVTVRDARQSGDRRGQMQSATRGVSSGVQTSNIPERSHSATQVLRSDPYMTTYQNAYGVSPPASPTFGANASHSVDLSRLKHELHELRAKLNCSGRNSKPKEQCLSSSATSPPKPPRRQHVQLENTRLEPVRDEPSYKIVNLDRGSPPPSPRQDLRIADPFVDSLRKYPYSAEQSSSADIIQRLLTYTQSKNTSNRVLTKRVQSLTRPIHESRSSYVKNMSNKNVQTYTRTSNKSPMRDISGVYGKPVRKKRVVSPPTNYQNDKSHQNYPETISYDYLKIGSFSQPNTDVRYLHDVTRYVKDTLREVCNSEEAVCSSMLDRYSTHLRTHHHVAEASTLTGQGNDEIAQTSGPTGHGSRFRQSNEHKELMGCRHETSKTLGSNICQKIIELKERLCQICKQPTPCQCKLPPCSCPENQRPAVKDRLKSIDFFTELRRLYTQEPIYTACTCPRDIDKYIDDTVDEWLKLLPMNFMSTNKERTLRYKIISDLKYSLKQHFGDCFESRKDVFRCLKHLPMNLPPEKNDRDELIEKIGIDLLKRVENIDIFGSRITNWVEALPFQCEIRVDKKRIANNLTNKLQNIAVLSDDLRNDLKGAVYLELKYLPLSTNSSSKKEELIENLVESLVNLPPEVIHSIKYLDKFSFVGVGVDYLEKIKNWLDVLPFEHKSRIDTEPIALELNEEVHRIIKTTEAVAMCNTVKTAIENKLVNFPIQGGKPEIKNQVLKLTNNLLPDMVYAITLKWTKTVAFEHDSKLAPETIAYKLTQKLIPVFKDIDLDNATKYIKNTICDELKNLPILGSPNLQISHADKLANDLSNLILKENITETIKEWINGIPFQREPSFNKRQVVNELSEIIQFYIASTKPTETWFSVRQEVIENLKKLPTNYDDVELETHAGNLYDQILNSMFKEAVEMWVLGLPFNSNNSIINEKLFSDDLSKKINDPHLRYADSNQVKDFIRDYINHVITDEMVDCNQIEKSKLIGNLLDTIDELPKPRDKILIIVKNFFRQKLFLKLSLSEDKINKLVKNIKSIFLNTHPREVWNTVKIVILAELEEIPLDIFPTEMQTLAEDLATRLTGDVYHEIVKDWISNIRIDPQSETETYTVDLANKLKNAVVNVPDEESEALLWETISRELEHAPFLSDDAEKKLQIEKLLNALKKIHPERNQILMYVEDWMKTVPFKPELPVNKIKVTKHLAKNIHHVLATMKAKDAWDGLKLVAKDELARLPINGDPVKIDNLADNLANFLESSIFEEAILKWVKTIPFDVQQDFDKNILVDQLTKNIKEIVPNADNQGKENKFIVDAIIGSISKFPLLCTLNQKRELAEELLQVIAELPKERYQFSQTLLDWANTIPFEDRQTVNDTQFVSDLKENLRNVLSSVPPNSVRMSMKEGILETFLKFNLKCDETKRAELAQTLTDELLVNLFSDTIRKWIKSVPIKNVLLVDEAELTHKLIHKLKTKFSSDFLDIDGLIVIVYDELAKLPVDCNYNEKDLCLKKLAKLLIDDLIKLPPDPKQNIISPTSRIKREKSLENANLLLEPEENKEIVKEALDKLRMLRSEANDEASIEKEIRRYIKDGVNNILTGKEIDPNTKVNLEMAIYKQVYDKYHLTEKEIKQKLLPELIKNIRDWLAENLELSNEKNIHEKLSRELSEKIAKEVITGGTLTHIKNRIILEIDCTLDVINPALKHDSNLKKTLTENLIQKLDIEKYLHSYYDEKKENIIKNLYRVECFENSADNNGWVLSQRLPCLDEESFDKENQFRENKIPRNETTFANNETSFVDGLCNKVIKTADNFTNTSENLTCPPEHLTNKNKLTDEIFEKYNNMSLLSQVIKNDASNEVHQPTLTKHNMLTNKQHEKLSNTSSNISLVRGEPKEKYSKEKITLNVNNKVPMFSIEKSEHKQFQQRIFIESEFQKDNDNVDKTTKIKLSAEPSVKFNDNVDLISTCSAEALTSFVFKSERKFKNASENEGISEEISHLRNEIYVNEANNKKNLNKIKTILKKDNKHILLKNNTNLNLTDEMKDKTNLSKTNEYDFMNNTAITDDDHDIILQKVLDTKYHHKPFTSQGLEIDNKASENQNVKINKIHSDEHTSSLKGEATSKLIQSQSSNDSNKDTNTKIKEFKAISDKGDIKNKGSFLKLSYYIQVPFIDEESPDIKKQSQAELQVMTDYTTLEYTEKEIQNQIRNILTDELLQNIEDTEHCIRSITKQRSKVILSGNCNDIKYYNKTENSPTTTQINKTIDAVSVDMPTKQTLHNEVKDDNNNIPEVNSQPLHGMKLNEDIQKYTIKSAPSLASFQTINSSEEKPAARVNETHKKEILVFQKDVSRWLEDIPETASLNAAQRKINEKISEKLAKELLLIYSSISDTNELKKVVYRNIKEHLEDVLEKKGNQMTSREKNRLSNKLTNVIARSASVGLKLLDSQDLIWEWIHDIPVLAQDITTDKRQTVHNLYKSLQKIQKKSVSDDIKKVEMKKDINMWLKETMKNKILDQNTKDKLVTKLVEDIQLSTKLWESKAETFKESGTYRQSTSNKISVCQYSERASKDFLQNSSNRRDSDGLQELSKEIDAKTQDKVFGLLAENIDSIDEPEERELIRKQIIEILKTDAKLPESEAIEFTKSILKNALEQEKAAQIHDKEFMSVLRKEIRRILEECPINEEHKSHAEEYLMDKEVKRLLGRKSEDDTENDALKILKEKFGLTENDALAMLRQLDSNYERLQQSPALNKSEGIKFDVPKKHSNNYDVGSKAAEILNDLFKTYVNKPTAEKEKATQAVVEETVANIEEILNKKKDGDNNSDLLRKELIKQLRKLPLDTNESITNLAENVLQQIENANATTPKKQLRKGTAYPHALKKYADTDGNNARFDSKGRRLDSQANTFSNELESAIGNWLEHVPVDHNYLQDEFKDTVIKDLAEDIIERNKYLQLNPNIKTSDADEYDYLADKCDLWMKSFMDNDDLKTAITYKKDLIEAIRHISVPKLTSGNTDLQNEIMAWQDSLLPRIKPTVDEKSAEELSAELAKSILKLKNKPDAEEKIRREIAKVLPEFYEDLNDDSLQRLESSLYNALKKKGFTYNTLSPNDPIEKKTTEAILNWLKQTPMYQKASSPNLEKMELASANMANGIKNEILAARLAPGAVSDKLIREKIMGHLPNIITNPESRSDEDFMNRVADSILIYLKGQNMFTDLTDEPLVDTDLVALAIVDWVSNLAIDTKTLPERTRLDEAIKKLVLRLKQARSQFHPTMPQHDQAIRDEARKFLRFNLTDPRKKSNERYIEDMVNKLVRIFQAVPIETIHTQSSIKPYKSPFDTLYEYIEEWTNNLPVQGEAEKVNWIKQNLAKKLVNKIGELNMNPDIFKDHDLYQDLLEDEIDLLLKQVPRNLEMNKYLPALQKDLLYKIMDARQKMLEELSGTFYKQQLREIISTSMPLPGTLTVDDQAALELLKDKIADAFINLRYSPNNEKDTNIYKKKVLNEIHRFCSDVVRRYPCARIDVDKLKIDLHCALVKVPVPRDDTMKSEVEQVRLRELIDDWMKDVPFRQETTTERLHRHKLAAVLAKRIHYIEMEKQHNDFIDSELKISEEITRFINKLHIVTDKEFFIPELVQKLVDKINRSESFRKFISYGQCQTSEVHEDILCSKYPCTLTQEDQDHLRRIKQRQKECYDTVVFSPSTDSCSQTYDTNSNWVQQKPFCGVKRATCLKFNATKPEKRDKSCMTLDTTECPTTPRVIMKEYIWESPESCKPLYSQKRSVQGIQTPNILREPLQRRTSNSYTIPMEQERRTSNSYTVPMEQPKCSEYDFSKSPFINQQPIPYEPVNSSPYQFDNHTGFYDPQSSFSEPQEQFRPLLHSTTKSPLISDRSSPTCCWSPFEERESSFDNYRPCTVDNEVSIDDDYPIAESARYYRRLSPDCCVNINDKPVDVKRRPLRCDKRIGRLGGNEDFLNPFKNQHGRRPDCSYKSDRTKDNGKCNCKERFLICKGLGKGYADICQSCGLTCPHPRPLFFN